jgi:Zn-finger nucleic acid-binding protein
MTDSMKCPRCQIALQPRIYEADVQVDGCTECGGRWLDHRELERIEEAAANDYKEQLSRPEYLLDRSYEVALQRSRSEICCPRCGQPMSKTECHPTSLVLVDLCPGCAGLWLDRGEVQALEVFFERMRQEERQAAKLSLVAALRRLFGGAG